MEDFDTSWDVNKYHYNYEMDHHWELKKQFIEQNKLKVPEKQLACMAQVFYNTEVLGCTYSNGVMSRLKTLANGITSERLEKEKTRFQRAFVDASQAASSKVKGITAVPKSTENVHDLKVGPKRNAEDESDSKRLKVDDDNDPPVQDDSNENSNKKHNW